MAWVRREPAMAWVRNNGSVRRVPIAPVAGRAHVPGKVGATEAAARELGIRKPVELLVQGRSLVVVDASPEPSGDPRAQAPGPAVLGRCTPDHHRAWRGKRFIGGHCFTHDPASS